jgi:hypothetical protein
MATDESDTNQLKIRCPKCGQRFKVSPDLRNKMVECGACEHRFRIKDDVILRTRKFYPGEHKNPELARFARAPIRQPVPVNFETATYSVDVSPDEFEPPSIQRILAGFFGWTLMLLTALGLFLFQGASNPSGSAAPGQRMLLAGFLALVASCFILYANRKNRVKIALGVLTASLLIVGLASLTSGRAKPGGETPVAENAAKDDRPGGTDSAPALPTAEDDRFAELKKEIRYGPVQQEIDLQKGNAERVTAIWLRGMLERYKYSVEDYMRRVTGADHSSHMYPRGDADFLYVMTGADKDIETTARYCKRLGEVVRVIHPLRVIEVNFDSSRFAESPLELLTNPAGEDFYKLNLKELESIDLKRAENAVDRLTAAPPAKLRADITRRFISLLNEMEPETLGKLGKALDRWSKPGDGAEAAVLKRAFELKQNGDDIAEGLVAFLLNRKVKEVQPILHDLWLKNPDNWELLYINLGPDAETPMLAALANPTFSTRDSAVRILARIGTPASIPTLEGLLKINDRKLQTDVNRAIEQIRKRASGS